MKKETKNNRGNARPCYVSPSADVVDVNVQCVLCQSGGNENLYEEDWGTGGFSFGGNN